MSRFSTGLVAALVLLLLLRSSPDVGEGPVPPEPGVRSQRDKRTSSGRFSTVVRGLAASLLLLPIIAWFGLSLQRTGMQLAGGWTSGLPALGTTLSGPIPPTSSEALWNDYFWPLLDASRIVEPGVAADLVIQSISISDRRLKGQLRVVIDDTFLTRLWDSDREQELIRWQQGDGLPILLDRYRQQLVHVVLRGVDGQQLAAGEFPLERSLRMRLETRSSSDLLLDIDAPLEVYPGAFPDDYSITRMYVIVDLPARICARSMTLSADPAQRIIPGRRALTGDLRTCRGPSSLTDGGGIAFVRDSRSSGLTIEEVPSPSSVVHPILATAHTVDISVAELGSLGIDHAVSPPILIRQIPRLGGIYDVRTMNRDPLESVRVTALVVTRTADTVAYT
jgi:hypothetical protein